MISTKTSIDKARIIPASSSTYTWLFSSSAQIILASILLINRMRLSPTSLTIDKAKMTPTRDTTIDYEK